MKKTILLVLLIVFGSLNLFAQSKVTEEEYLVYEKVFEHIFGFNYRPEDKPHFVILEDTISIKTVYHSTYYSLEYFLKSKSDFDNLYKINPQKDMTPQRVKELVEDFDKKKLSPGKLERKFSIKQDYTIISQSDLDKLLAEGKMIYDEMPDKELYELHSGGIIWKPFRDKYPTSKGCYNLSRVGFSKDKNFALVFVHQENGDSSFFTYYIFEKVDDEWENPKMFGWSRIA